MFPDKRKRNKIGRVHSNMACSSLWRQLGFVAAEQSHVLRTAEGNLSSPPPSKKMIYRSDLPSVKSAVKTTVQQVTLCPSRQTFACTILNDIVVHASLPRPIYTPRPSVSHPPYLLLTGLSVLVVRNGYS